VVGVQLPFSRHHEAEADEIGLYLMAEAGYDPRAAVTFWQRMEDKGGTRPPAILSTHPGPDQRIQRLNAIMPDAIARYERS